MPGYIYASDDDALYWNLFVASSAKVKVGDATFGIDVTGAYPYKGELKLTISSIELKS